MDPVTWPLIGIMLSSVGVVSTIIIAAFTWIYKELNKIRNDQFQFQIEVAHNYATLSLLKDLDAKLEVSINKLVDKFDKLLVCIYRYQKTREASNE